jgi:hypothetical protein
VRILAAPDEKQRRLEAGDPGQRVVRLSRAERGGVDIGGVKARRGGDGRVIAGAHGEMAAEADAEAGDLPRGALVAAQPGGEHVHVLVVGGEFLGILQLVAAVGAGLIVGEHGAGGLELMVHFRHGNEVALPRQRGGHPADRAGGLEDLGVEDDRRKRTAADRGENVHAHEAAGGIQIDVGLGERGHAPTLPPGPGLVKEKGGLAAALRMVRFGP